MAVDTDWESYADHHAPGGGHPGPGHPHPPAPNPTGPGHGGSSTPTPSGTLAPALKAALAALKASQDTQGAGGGLDGGPGDPAGTGVEGGSPGVSPAPVHAGGAATPTGAGAPGHGHRRRLLTPKRAVPGTDPNPRAVLEAKLRAGLKAKATKLGLPTLPGSGSLTLATRYVEGGRATVLSYIKLAAMNGNDSAMTWWHVYETLSPYERSVVSFDDICASAGISPKALLMAVAASGFDAGCDIANLVAAHLHPKVVEASAKAALTAEGIEDRKLLLQHAGFIPVPKGTAITINASSHAVAQSHAQAVSASSVPSFLSDVADLTDVTKAVQGEIVEASTKELGPAPAAPPWEGALDVLTTKAKVG